MNTPATASILLVEDDLRLSELVSRFLQGNGFHVAIVHRGDEVRPRVQRERPDLVILDIGLPGQDGFSVCRELRPIYSAPILILTARESDIDHVLGLELGADDYVIKPVEPRVLMARVNALLRRSRSSPAHDAGKLRFGALLINMSARSVTLHEQAITLSGNEFDLLVRLASHAGTVQSRDALYRSLFGREYDGFDRLLDVRMSHLRRKLGEDAERSERIKTVWGQGYLFVSDAW
jgi:DNA-binding response OmpR family regulator